MAALEPIAIGWGSVSQLAEKEENLFLLQLLTVSASDLVNHLMVLGGLRDAGAHVLFSDLSRHLFGTWVSWDAFKFGTCSLLFHSLGQSIRGV